MNRTVMAVFVFCVFLAGVSTSSEILLAQDPVEKPVSITEGIKQTKKAVVFIGNIDQGPNAPVPPDGILLKDIDPKTIQFRATGFLIVDQGITHLVTAKHVVDGYGKIELKDGKPIQSTMDDGMFVFFNRKDGKIGFRSIGYVRRLLGANWVFHNNTKVDVAIVPFATNNVTDEILTIPDEKFLDASKLQELYEVFFVAYQPGAESQTRISPVIRGGMISLINDDKTFYFDGFAFPGNSGSPVFYKPSLARFSETGFSIGNDPLAGKFIGIVGEYVPYQEIAISAQTKRPRIMFEEHTGLSRVWSANFLKEIKDSPEFKEQLKRLVDKTRQQ